VKFLYQIQGSSEGVVKEVFKTLLANYSERYDFSKIYHFGGTGLQNFFAKIIFTQLIKEKSFIPPYFFTLKEFAIFILEREGWLKDYKIIDSSLKPVIILNLLKEKFTFGYGVILAEFISELKQYYYEKKIKDIFLKRLETFPKAYENLELAFQVKEEYEEYLKKNKFLDEEDCQFLANKIIKEKGLKIPYLIINGFIDFTNLEKDLVSTLIKSSDNVFVITFLKESKNFDFFKSLADFSIIEYQKDLLPSEETIFTLPIHAYSTIEEEVEGILKRIKLNHLKKKKDLSSVILVTPNLRKYQPILERVSQRLALPYGIFKAMRLKDLLPFSFLIEMLKTIDEDYPRLKTALIFSLPYCEKFSAETKKYINFLSRIARVIGGKNDWLYLKDTLLKINDQKIKNLLEKGVIDKIMKDINDFFNLAEELKDNNYLNEFIFDLRKLLQKIEFLKKEDLPEIVAAGLLKFYEILSRLEDFSIPLDFPQFIKIIDYHLTSTPIEIEKDFSGIKIIDLHDLVIWDFSFLKNWEFYLFGLVEEDVPGKYRPEPLIPEYLKKEFALPNSDLHLFRERSYLYSLLKTVYKNCYLSTHNFENENPVLLTPFLEGKKVKPEEIKIILSNEELQILNGKKESPFFNIEKTKKTFENIATEENPLAITKLVKYLKCPYKFYLEEVIGLSLEEESSVAIEKWEWGRFIHLIMQKIYQEEKVPPIDGLEKIIKEKAKEFWEKEVSFGILPLWRDFFSKLLEKIIPKIVRVERDLRNSGFLPYKMEYSLQEEIIDGIYLKGRIDRIDKKGNSVFIIDYKTSDKKPFTFNQMRQEKDLIQIVAYSFLWEKKFPDCKCEKLGIYYLLDAEIKTPKEEELKMMKEYLLVTVKKSIEQLRKGDFSVTEVEKSRCYFCNYYFLCEKEQL